MKPKIHRSRILTHDKHFNDYVMPRRAAAARTTLVICGGFVRLLLDKNELPRRIRILASVAEFEGSVEVSLNDNGYACDSFNGHFMYPNLRTMVKETFPNARKIWVSAIVAP